MVLEDPTLPLVSTQALYKVGGRTESSGATGLAPMSNEEISALYGQDWIVHGRLLSDEEEERRLRKATREDVLAVIDRFLSGAYVVVDVAPQKI